MKKGGQLNLRRNRNIEPVNEFPWPPGCVALRQSAVESVIVGLKADEEIRFRGTVSKFHFLVPDSLL